ARAAGNRRVEALSLGALAMLAVDEGRLQDGLVGLQQAYRIDRADGYRLEIAHDLYRFARTLASAGQWRAAAQLFSKGEALREETGDSLGSWSVIEAKLEDTLTASRAHLGEAAFAEAWEEGRALSLDDAVALALDPGE
ncbi:MAG: hypothetical protein M3O80_00895, partial [Chloroflexota bacterium]|nr:hypothetical protein [Chloroflexota bacterium]